jgi:lycopene beta-cyclase
VQSAFGLLVRGRDAELPPGTALFMDWRSAGVDDGGPPSFLYALAGDDGRLLLEETTLASSAPVPFDLLERRLRARLGKRGTVIDDVLDTERVCFPMGGGVPRAGQEVAAFGAAAGLVMPVSGYSMARAFQAAAPFATTIADGLRGGRTSTQIVADVTNVQWTRSAQHLRTLQRFGMSAMCSFDAADANAFFAAFFALPSHLWRGFFDGTGSVADAQRTMWQLFRQVPSRVRLRLAGGARLQDSVAVVFSMAGQKLASAGGSP